MSDDGSPQRAAKVLSATLQALTAKDMGANEGAAFMAEFRDRFEAANYSREAYEELFLDMSSALFSVVQFVAEQNSQDPRKLLGELVRTYRRAID